MPGHFVPPSRPWWLTDEFETGAYPRATGEMTIAVLLAWIDEMLADAHGSCLAECFDNARSFSKLGPTFRGLPSALVRDCCRLMRLLEKRTAKVFNPADWPDEAKQFTPSSARNELLRIRSLLNASKGGRPAGSPAKDAALVKAWEKWRDSDKGDMTAFAEHRRTTHKAVRAAIDRNRKSAVKK